jgi:DNA-binding SARP family transcriptional activator
VRFALLGALVLIDETGARHVLRGPRQRVLLAALLLYGNEPVPLDVLAELVWDGSPPARYAVTLRSHVRQLRRHMGCEAQRITARDPGYMVRVERGEFDVLMFGDECARAETALRAHEWAAASSAATDALGLWRGSPLLDVPSQALRDAFTPALEVLRLETLEHRIEADLQLGRHHRLVSSVRELAAQHPLRERFHAQLMLALARCGRQAEALEAYRDARRILVDELGIEPGPELRELHGRILAGEEEPPASIIADRASVPTAAVAIPRQLPAAPGHFTGRQTELEWLSGLLQQPDIAAGCAGTVVISAIDGMAGIGKTALAVHAAHRLAEAFPDGQLFIDLHGYTRGHPPREPGQVLEWLLRALGVSIGQVPEDTEARAALYRQRLADTRTLILLDNALDEAQVRPLLPAASGCMVLVTSRRRLKGLDDAHSLSLDVLPPADAVALLRAMSGPDRIPCDDAVLGEIAHLCGLLPLALRIAWALVRHRPAWSLEHLAGLLRDQHRRVSALADGERDLATVFDLSYTSLDARHRLLLRRLALAPGPDADAYAASALLECDPQAATKLLEGLVDHNLLIAYAPGRYRLHDLIRAHTAALADKDPDCERNSALDRLLHYYAHTAQSASITIARYPRSAPDGPAPAYARAPTGPDAGRVWLRTERDNLEAAHAHAHACDLDENVVALAAGLAEILLTDGPLTQALELHRAAAATAQRHGWSTAHATALTDLAVAQRCAGDSPTAVNTASQALEIHRAAGDQLGQAVALLNLGIARLWAGDRPGGDDALTQALAIYRAVGNHHGEAAALLNLGCMWASAGDRPGAEDAFTRALENYRAVGNHHGEASALANLGDMRRLAGDLKGASDAFARALKIFRAAGHRIGEATALTELASVWRLAGNPPAAVDAVSRALEIFRAAGSRHNESWAFNHYAAAVAASGDTPLALVLYRQALAMNRELNKPDEEAIALEGLAECHVSAGQSETALVHLRQALEAFQRLGMAVDIERVRTRLADLAAARTNACHPPP